MKISTYQNIQNATGKLSFPVMGLGIGISMILAGIEEILGVISFSFFVPGSIGIGVAVILMALSITMNQFEQSFINYKLSKGESE